MVEPEQNKGGAAKVILLIVGIVVLAAVGLAFISNVLRSARERAYSPNCTENLRAIMKACEAYADENNGHLPTDLRMLLNSGRLSEEVLLCSAISKEDRDYGSPPYADYQYFGKGLILSDLANSDQTVLAAEPWPVHRDGTIAIMFASGRVAMVTSRSIQEIARKKGWAIPSQRAQSSSKAEAVEEDR